MSELQAEIDSVEESNKKLKGITKVQDKNVESLVDLVKENQGILDEMRVSSLLRIVALAAIAASTLLTCLPPI